MNIFGIIIIICLAFFGVLGCIIGLVKGFTNVRSWANEYILTAVVVIAISGLLRKNVAGDSDTLVAAAVTICVAALLLVLFALFSELVRTFLSRKIERRRQRSLYEQHDDIADREQEILDAVYDGDNKKYKKLVDEKIKVKSGGWRVADRILGGLTLAVKGVTIVGIISALFIAFFDMTRLTVVAANLSEVFASSAWAYCKDRFADFAVIGVMLVCIKCGYRGGLFKTMWPLVVIALVCGSALLAYMLAFKSTAFESLIVNLSAKIGEKMGETTQVSEVIGWYTPENFARIILLGGIFVILLIFVVLIAIFVPKMVAGARTGASFRVIDGVLGAIISTAIVLGIFLLLGGMLQTVSSAEFMGGFNAFFGNSKVAVYFYGENVLNVIGFIPVDLSSLMG